MNTPFDDVVLTSVTTVNDQRGGLTKVFADGTFTAPGLPSMRPKQILHSRTAQRRTLRGLHAQQPPFTEAKLIIALTGHMHWVLVDLRANSTSFGAWQGFDLTPEGPNALFAPRGFAHGCLSMTDEVNLLILADNEYSPAHGIGIAWDDRKIDISWPLDGATPMISDAHQSFGSLAAFKEHTDGL